MALTKEVVTDKVEVVGEHKHVQCREATIVKEDGVEVGRSVKRHVLHASRMHTDEDGVITHTDTDISGEPAETQAICNAVWTDAVVAAYKTWCEENEEGGSGDGAG